MRNLTIDEVKYLMRSSGNNPSKYSDEELNDIAKSFVKDDPDKMIEWEMTHHMEY